MTPIPFVKYTSFGNTFVIVDETRNPLLSERQKSRFAYQATNVDFGIGCDNLLIIQKYSAQVLDRINAEHGYFNEIPEADNIQYVFRMFEPSGEEAYSCGNGLMSIASYLRRHCGISEGHILTEIPTGSPKKVRIGADGNGDTTWADMGLPVSVPPQMVHPSAYRTDDNGLDRILPLEIRFRVHDLTMFTTRDSMTLWGYLVYTGEPHLVIFPESGFSIRELADVPFISPSSAGKYASNAEKRYNFGIWLVEQIGSYLNTHYRSIFPKGINVNFARKVGTNNHTLEYRCFERGINRETLACGTGALAVSYIAKKLAVTNGKRITLWPCRCRWHKRNAEIHVTETEAGWRLSGKPHELFGGIFLSPMEEVRPSAVHRETSNCNLNRTLIASEGHPA